jgi:hypothetical protein
VRRATARYHNIDAALADGYVLNPAEPCVSSPAGVMGIHVINPSLTNDGVVNAETPEALLYLPMENGKYRLIGVEYLLWFTPTTPTPALFGEVFQGPMPGHSPTMPTHWDLHVWLWANNPSGMFAQFNPSLSCDAS